MLDFHAWQIANSFLCFHLTVSHSHRGRSELHTLELPTLQGSSHQAAVMPAECLG
jgi:hypothetical protein